MNVTFKSLKEKFDEAALFAPDITNLKFSRCGENFSYGSFAIMEAEIAGEDYSILCNQLDLEALKQIVDQVPFFEIQGLLATEIEKAADDLMENMKYRTELRGPDLQGPS